MGRVRVDVLRVGSGTGMGTKSTGTGIPVLPVKNTIFTMLELYRMYDFLELIRPVLANNTGHVVFKTLYKYYKCMGQKSSMCSDYRFS